MPSVAVAEPQSAAADKKKIMKKAALAEMEVEEKSAEKKVKKEKKSSKKTKLTSEPDPDDSNSASPVKVKKEKKRKALEIDGDNEEEKSDTSSEMGEPMNGTTKKKKKVKVDDEKEEEEKVDDPNAVTNFRISAPLRETLKSKGIEALFPIQAMTFDIILDGSDLIGRARTGQVRVLDLFLPVSKCQWTLLVITAFTVIFTNACCYVCWD